MDLVAWLCSPAAARPLAVAAAALDAHPDDPLSAGTAVRRQAPDLAPELAACALAQAGLREAARQRYGIDASTLLLTRDGLEQATRPEVAAGRATLLADADARTVLDLTAGLGFDAAAFCAAGLRVVAVEREAGTATLCAHNVPAAEVLVGDATNPVLLAGLLARLGPRDVVFVDPARRSLGAARDLGSARARPERDPERWSPPWSFVAGIPHPRVALKAAPSFRPPPGWQAQWTSLDRTVLECTAYSWPVLPASRQAVVLDEGDRQVVDASEAAVPRALALGAWLLEPDPAIVRAGVEAGLLGLQPDLAAVGPGSSWLTCDAAPAPGLAGLVRAYRVVMELSGSPRQRRQELRRRGIDALAVKTRDVREGPAQVLRALGCREGTSPMLILTPWRGRVVSLLADPVLVPRD